MRSSLKGGRVLVATLLLAPMLAAGALAAWIWQYGASPRYARSDCIVILGCRVYGVIPSPFLQARLDEGLRLYEEGYADYIIVSGGQGPGEDISEAEAMKRYLVNSGVASSLIIKEDQSTSTETNLRFSYEKMKERGLQTAIIISNQYHLARSALIAKRIGLDAGNSGVRVRRYKHTEISGLLREVPAFIYAFFSI